MKLAGSLFGCIALGSAACATSASAEPLRHERGGYDVEVLVDGMPAPTFSHRGESYVLGQLGERYVLRIANRTGRRVEAVVSVDGRDVIDGKPADVRKRGYLVPAWGSVDIEGWRVSAREAAAFRFSSVADSYAARTGSAREVGVIGVAVFPERVTYYPRPPYYPSEIPFSPPYDRMEREGSRKSKPAPPASRSGATADASEPPRAAEARGGPSPRPGLGTEFGEQLSAPVREVPFVRAVPGRPSVTLGCRYNDEPGLVALGIDLDGPYRPDDTFLRQTATPFPTSYRGYAAPPPGWRGR
jgi:hypothetical protein